MKIYRLLSILFTVVSFVLVLNVPINFTGNVINKEFSAGNIFFGIIFLAFGLALLLIVRENVLERNVALTIKKSGQIITDSKKMRRIAVDSGYEVCEEGREGAVVYDSNKRKITTIPNHLSYRISQDILKRLGTGEPNFRKREHYN